MNSNSISRRLVLCLLAAATATVALPFRAYAASNDDPAAVVQSFYDTLLQAMKGGAQLGFKGRRDLLAPSIEKNFDLPLMTRLTAGLQWQGFSPEDQQNLVTAFSEYSIATYANQFDGYSGERFEVEPAPVKTDGGDDIVKTKLVLPKDDPVQLDYLMRQESGGWKIIDVYLSGTISQLAARRSEFSTVLRNNGVTGLINLLHQKTAQLAG
jgi:phospholipid transport system substrate-binding protein